ncbi:MAG TPA: pilin [Candidatus Babeliales bacterium]|nr:pilin [Candidatus Babeliales bacterium]
MKARLIFISVLAVVALYFSSVPALATFNPLGSLCKSAAAQKSPTCQQNKNQNGSSKNPGIDLIQSAVSLIAVLAGIVAVIMIVVSGFMFITAGGATPGQRSGDPNRIKSARATLTNSLIGLVIVALAWAIVTFITNQLANT